jgi:hypothetical protein
LCSDGDNEYKCRWGKPLELDSPINCVTYYDAVNYCAWKSKKLVSAIDVSQRNKNNKGILVEQHFKELTAKRLPMEWTRTQNCQKHPCLTFRRAIHQTNSTEFKKYGIDSTSQDAGIGFRCVKY